MTYLSFGLRALLTLAFVGAGIAKLAGATMMVEVFDALGAGQWFRYVTGLIEIGGAALLWMPNRQSFGALILGGTMVGAILAHLLFLGPSMAPAAVLALLSAAVVYLHREQIFDAKGPTGE